MSVSDGTDELVGLCLGSTSPKKVVHRSTCRHARKPYEWARRFPTMEALIDEVWGSGAWRWHVWCSFCLPEFLAYERRTYMQ